MQKWSQEFRQRNIDETKNYLTEVINRNELMSKNHKKVCTTWAIILFYNYWMCFHFCFGSSVGIPIGITSSAVELRCCVITVVIKKSKSIITKKKRKHDKIVLFAKSKLNNIEVLISKALVDSVIIHDKFVLMNNVLKKCNKMIEEIKNLKAKSVYLRF